MLSCDVYSLNLLGVLRKTPLFSAFCKGRLTKCYHISSSIAWQVAVIFATLASVSVEDLACDQPMWFSVVLFFWCVFCFDLQTTADLVAHSCFQVSILYVANVLLVRQWHSTWCWSWLCPPATKSDPALRGKSHSYLPIWHWCMW